ncbi:response regulator [Oligoflexia bacterium]|nr:response regulator [Oligoflexia bacterium]
MDSKTTIVQFLKRQGVLTEAVDQSVFSDHEDGPLSALAERNLIDESVALESLSKTFSFRVVDIKRLSLDEKQCAATLLEQVDGAICSKYNFLPLYEAGTTTEVAFANPLDIDAIQTARFVCGGLITPVLARGSEIQTFIESADEERHATPPTEDTGLRKDRVLVIDDDPDIRSIVSLVLEKEMFEVCQAEDGLDGINKVHAEEPDLVVLDLTMPIMNGEQFVRKMNRNRNTKDIPIVVYTAAGQVEDELNLFRLGVADYVTKGSSQKVLISRIRNALN